MPLRVRFPPFGLAVFGDSIRMSLMTGSERGRIILRPMIELRKKASKENLESIS